MLLNNVCTVFLFKDAKASVKMDITLSLLTKKSNQNNRPQNVAKMTKDII